MNCPYCGQAMEPGQLRSRGGVFFLPDGESLPKLYSEKEMDRHKAISFPPYLFQAKSEFPAAYVCRKCGKIIMDFQHVR